MRMSLYITISAHLTVCVCHYTLRSVLVCLYAYIIIHYDQNLPSAIVGCLVVVGCSVVVVCGVVVGSAVDVVSKVVDGISASGDVTTARKPFPSSYRSDVKCRYRDDPVLTIGSGTPCPHSFATR